MISFARTLLDLQKAIASAIEAARLQAQAASVTNLARANATTNGFQPVRDRLGVQYEDDCLRLGLTWRRDYDILGATRKGSTFSLQIALKGLGR